MAPPPATYFWLDPKVGKSSSPHCARPCAFGSWVSKQPKNPGARAELASVRCAHSAQTDWPSLKGCVPAARGPACCAPRRHRRREAANSQQPNLGSLTAGSELTAGCSVLGCSTPSAPPSSAEARGSARSALRLLASRSLFERSEPQVSAVSSARPPGSEQHREPDWPQAKRASAMGSPFYSPLFFGEAKKRGSGFGAEGPKRSHEKLTRS